MSQVLLQNKINKTYDMFRNLVFNRSSITNITLIEGLSSIGRYAFRDCRALTSITIPNSVTSIGKFAFYICQALTSIAIPNGVTSISEGTFRDCQALTSITIPNSVTSIGEAAFFSCHALTSIAIPSSVTSIGLAAFRDCQSLASVTVEAVTPPILSDNVFTDTDSNLVIYVPAESVDAYKAANRWSTYADKIQAIPTWSLAI